MLHTLIVRATRNSAAVSLGGLGALHVLWATGSAWPAADRPTLADAIGGFADVPPAGPCLVVASLLALAACCVAGAPRRLPGVSRAGSVATCFVIGARGCVGLAGAMPNGRRSAVFAQLDRRVYSPICVALAVMSLIGTSRA